VALGDLDDLGLVAGRDHPCLVVQHDGRDPQRPVLGDGPATRIRRLYDGHVLEPPEVGHQLVDPASRGLHPLRRLDDHGDGVPLLVRGVLGVRLEQCL
jgi:hypothetical protein